MHNVDLNPAETAAWVLLRILFNDSMLYSMAYGICMPTGMGKTFTSVNFKKDNKNVIYFKCTSKTKPIEISRLEKRIKHDENLIIFDDAQHTTNDTLLKICELSNEITGISGTILLGDENLRLRIKKGVENNVDVFNEAFKSFGRRFLTLGALGPKDIELVCKSNGIDRVDKIEYIQSECKNLFEVKKLLKVLKF